MTERRYQMVRLAAGDYVLVSNDATTLWRFRRYWEDGSLDNVRGWFWSASYFDGTLEQGHSALLRELGDATDDRRAGWVEYANLRPTRGAAIQSALARAPRSDPSPGEDKLCYSSVSATDTGG